MYLRLDRTIGTAPRCGGSCSSPTAGTGIRGRVENLKESGEYLRSHILAATALELAEAAAERLHRHLRTLWGIPDPPEMGVADYFRTRYRGLRVSFGYPACPRLEDQAELFADSPRTDRSPTHRGS